MNQDDKRENECWERSADVEGIESAVWAVAAGLYALASNTLRGAKHLGLQDASTPMGALEAVSQQVKEIASAIREHGEMVRRD